jgi:hypothetical protein
MQPPLESSLDDPLLLITSPGLRCASRSISTLASAIALILTFRGGLEGQAMSVELRIDLPRNPRLFLQLSRGDSTAGEEKSR